MLAVPRETSESFAFASIIGMTILGFVIAIIGILFHRKYAITINSEVLWKV